MNKKEPPVLFLVGFMGMGKSTVGPLVADGLNWGYVDMDDAIAAGEGGGMNALMARISVKEFRVLERSWVGAMRFEQPMVVSCGGGVLLDAENLKVIEEQGTLVWLQGDLHTAYERVVADEKLRPTKGNGFRDFEAAYGLRLPGYERAEVVINVDRKRPEEIAQEVMASSGKC